MQEFLQEERQAESNVFVSGDQKLSDRSTSQKPVPILPLEKVPEDGHAPGRYALYWTLFMNLLAIDLHWWLHRGRRNVLTAIFEIYGEKHYKYQLLEKFHRN